MRKVLIAGWIIEVGGLILWTYGYFVIGRPPLIDWATHAPRWIAEFLPSLESEIGMVLVLVGMVPIYWPPPKMIAPSRVTDYPAVRIRRTLAYAIDQIDRTISGSSSSGRQDHQFLAQI